MKKLVFWIALFFSSPYASRSLADRTDPAFYWRELDELQQEARAEGKHPAAVAALRTMAEIYGLVGPQTSINDNRMQVLALPEGLTTEQLIAIATGTVMQSTDTSHSIRDIVRTSEEGDQLKG
jgi:hypothetical protein